MQTAHSNTRRQSSHYSLGEANGIWLTEYTLSNSFRLQCLGRALIEMRFYFLTCIQVKYSLHSPITLSQPSCIALLSGKSVLVQLLFQVFNTIIMFSFKAFQKGTARNEISLSKSKAISQIGFGLYFHSPAEFQYANHATHGRLITPLALWEGYQ